MTSQIKVYTSQIISFLYTKPKEKVDMILEPLQAMLQLALLSICPVGTKLQINENILHLQSPTFIQPISRWYYSDKKDDLFFLYSVIKRYIKWYNPLINEDSPLTQELYSLITAMSIEGLNQLFKTYSSSDSNTIIQVIQMYKSLLEQNNDKILSDEYMDIDKTKMNIDEVFENIIKIYDPILLAIIHNTLLLLKDDMENFYTIINGLNMILDKKKREIKEWIKCNLSV